jgi:hypothetical protein
MDRRVDDEDIRRVSLERARRLCFAWVYCKRNEWRGTRCRREDGRSRQWKKLEEFGKVKKRRPGIGVKHYSARTNLVQTVAVTKRVVTMS